MTPTADLAVWIIAGIAVAGVVVRPFRAPEALWPVVGGAVLLVLGLLPFGDALAAIGRGADVYLFLAGMILLSETARREGLFDWVAALAVNHSRGSPRRLFALVYGVGIVVTTFLSNDATAVVLTPAVFAVTRKAKVEPLSYVFICAFIANAASFVLPISNPANLVLYGGRTPALGHWLASFGLSSALAIAATFIALRWTQRRWLRGSYEGEVEQPQLSAGGWTALAGLALTAAVLMAVSALGRPLGPPTCVLGAATTAIVLVRKREGPWPTLSKVSWSVLPLVAGLFVLVAAVDRSGLSHVLAAALARASAASATATAAGAAAVVAMASNLINNLPAGLIASTVIAETHPPQGVVDFLLIGIDVGPNLSITGSLATVLWLAAIRRENADVGFWTFLKVGAVVMPPALILAVAARLLTG